jgi:hypothetical protein
MGDPRFYSPKIIEALGYHGSQELTDVVALTDDFIALRQLIQAYRQQLPDESNTRVELITTAQARLIEKARALRVHANPETQATSRALELALHLQHPWAVVSSRQLAVLAEELQNAVRRRKFSQCFFMDMTCAQIVLGMAASAEAGLEKGPQTDWLRRKLDNAIAALRARGWARPLEMADRGLLAEFGLLDKLEGLS